MPAGTGAGDNFGWNRFEGRHRFSDTPLAGGRLVSPVAEYSHALGISVIGGYVYRGSAVPALRGRYVFADYGSGRVWTMRAGPRPGPATQITGSLGRTLSAVTTFGQDATGRAVRGRQRHAVPLRPGGVAPLTIRGCRGRP